MSLLRGSIFSLFRTPYQTQEGNRSRVSSLESPGKSSEMPGALDAVSTATLPVFPPALQMTDAVGRNGPHALPSKSAGPPKIAGIATGHLGLYGPLRGAIEGLSLNGYDHALFSMVQMIIRALYDFPPFVEQCLCRLQYQNAFLGETPWFPNLAGEGSTWQFGEAE